ncbi:bifunctional acetate--CoA ligase family protein/GNAT family N-acetyltransferase [Denitrobaculum tricleocarpae]|uniref:Bifunctional acetate--CoA ligase family protein/GNAT family N-acetyltransferase n=1 Tax=Denitrobaculum tricleocarpae TaxID=2591009 RepID=A0A545TRP4_9PROT|nr:bifunctional acetate--CoA ligase family protein/GNAT family N-acetyltransferase [Denitrobaculum tricleocarpae]TQV79886.1 bifunctional acetate--CoA ligase family protein/GNAT family N-acetyltransferase [Denitrobaculum tricleocarpae]
MSIRHLDSLFNPKSLALIGASRRSESLGAVLAANLMSAGFEGQIYPIHPKAQEIGDRVAYPSVADLPEAPDLAVIATPPDAVPELIAQLAARGTRSAVVITAGFGEGGDQEGEQRLQDMLDAARTNTLRIVGPNCLGVIVPGAGLNASFSHIAALPGDLAFVTQSGAMVTAMLDWATPRGIGFSHVVSLGDKSDVDFGDMLDYLALDFKTRAILLYVESITHARKFMSAARAAARSKPVIVIKGGRYAEGAKAAASHTGALAGSDAVYDAVFARAGLLRVFSLEELFDAAETLATARSVRGDRLAIATNGGGLGVLATDALIEEGGRLAELTPETIDDLSAVLPATWSHSNPVDIIGDAPGERYAATLDALLKEPAADALLVMNCPTAVASSTEAAQSVISSIEKHTAARGRSNAKTVFTAWVGDAAAREARHIFSEKHIPTYDTPEQAVRGFMHLVRYRRNQELLSETPSSIVASEDSDESAPDWSAAHSIMVAAMAENREWLNEPEAKAVLAAYGIPVVQTFQVATPEEAAAAAERIDGPVALKILSPDLTHKSDIGGVELGLNGNDEVLHAAREMNARVSRLAPNATLKGFSVQSFCQRPKAQELILGAATDAQFGPVLLFGAGGTAVEVLGDKSIGLPPLNSTLARDLITRTRVFKLLEGYRDRPPADLDALSAALIRLSDLVVDFAEIAEIDINPLLADDQGVIALDARIRLCPKSASAIERLAIRPYPRELEQNFAIRDGTDIFLRPIRPEDEPMLQSMFDRLSPEDIRLRFFASLTELSHSFAARLTQIDYHREMAFVALKEGDDGEPEIWGVVRISADPDNERAEYAVLVRSDIKGRGLGAELMNRIIDYAVRRGLSEIWGDVLDHNKRMLELVKELGFSVRHLPDEPGIVRVVKRLDAVD